MTYDLNIPADAIADAEKAVKGGFNLDVPPNAADQRKNGWARWDEYATIEGASRESKTNKDGEDVVSFNLKFKILPFNDSINGGRTYTDFNALNYSALKKDGKVTEQRIDGQLKMNARTIIKLKQLAAIAGLSLDSGVTQEMLDILFPVPGSAEDMTGSAVLVGQNITVHVNDSPDKQTPGAYRTGIDGYAPAPEGL